MNDLVWLDGRILDTRNARIAPTDRGFLLSDGLFETIRISNCKTPHLTRHLKRLAEGCAVLGLPAPAPALLHKAVADLLEATALVDGSLRLTVTRGTGPRGVLPPHVPHPTILIQAAAPPPNIPSAVSLGIGRYQRDGASPLSRVKSLAFLPSILSRMEAVAAGLDDALLLGTTGAIAEASAANILFLNEDSLYTPPLHDGALPGTSRARLLEKGLCHERSISPEDLPAITGAWLVNALSLTPVSGIDIHEMSLHPEKDHLLRMFLFPD
ncbi:aminotransferase class IV [Gluconobacter potus]|uniref:aminotransferase class IV n=1 Tax=Gluconobacter potus TaxID=2724927 RepID=UPI0039E9BF5B